MTSKALYAWHENICVIKLKGDVRFTECPSIDSFIKTAMESEMNQVLLDLSETTLLDSTALGMLAQVAIDAKAKDKAKPTLVIDSNDMMTLLQSICFEKVFSIVRPDHSKTEMEFQTVKSVHVNEDELASQVLIAHQNLMQLSYGNHLSFQDVLDAMDKHQALTS